MDSNLLKKIFVENDCDAILFVDPKNIRYMCGFRGNNGLLFYTKNNKMLLVTDPRFELEAKQNVKNAEIVINVKESSLWEMPDFYKEHGINKLGFSSKAMTVEMFNSISKEVTMVPIDIIPSAYRYTKSAQEIKTMRESIRIQEKALSEVIGLLSEHPTEKVFAAHLDHHMRLNGAEKSAFDTIVAFAENSAVVHAIPSEKKIKGDGFLIIDWGAVYDGYCCDETVTYILGKPSKEMIQLYDDVHTAQRRAIEAVRPNVTAVELYEKAYGYLIDKGYKKYIQHSLGHHLGLDIHEYPKIFPFTEFTFKEGMVFTIEPGLYIPGLGGVRIEDMVMVTASGHEVLTTLSKEKKIIL
jgi:Xaa-Pro aminopeptidase